MAAPSRSEVRPTDGPWALGEPPYGTNIVVGVDRDNGQSQTVAVVFGYTVEEVLGNGHLIAAAREMYEALAGDDPELPSNLRPIDWAWGLLQDYEEMLRRHESQHPDPDAAWEHVSRVRRMLTLLQAALAKAEGREVREKPGQWPGQPARTGRQGFRAPRRRR